MTGVTPPSGLPRDSGRAVMAQSPAPTPATVRRKAAYAVAIGAAAAGLLVGWFSIALTIALTTNQTGSGATAQTVTSTITVPAASAAPTGTVAPTTTSTQQPTTYSGSGAFAVGDEPTGGLTAAIPAGRYRAEVIPGAGAGSVWQCNDLLCAPGNTSDLTAATPVFEGGPTLVQIQPTDAAVYLVTVTLTPVD